MVVDTRMEIPGIYFQEHRRKLREPVTFFGKCSIRHHLNKQPYRFTPGSNNSNIVTLSLKTYETIDRFLAVVMRYYFT
jgi:hypothetical protein